MENNKKHILVVDDDNRIRDLLKEYLNDNKYIVSTADNADNAKIKLDQFKFDLLVLDVMMPGQNGYDLTKEIKEKINVPIILLTAKGEVENRIKGLELGVDEYLGKPFEPKELLLRINNVIKKNIKINLNKKHFIGSTQIDLNKMSIIAGTNNKKINSSEKKVLIENGPFEIGEVSFHHNFSYHTAGRNKTNKMRIALANTFFADGARVTSNPTMVSGDWKKFIPGAKPKDLASSKLNPICWPVNNKK